MTSAFAPSTTWALSGDRPADEAEANSKRVAHTAIAVRMHNAD